VATQLCAAQHKVTVMLFSIRCELFKTVLFEMIQVLLINTLVSNVRYTLHTLYCSKYQMSYTDDDLFVQPSFKLWSAHYTEHLILIPEG
jgi:hypothetical protein